MTTAMSGRAAANRRLRRRASTASGQLYCSTNGCATYLIVDLGAGVARCPVCRAVRRLN